MKKIRMVLMGISVWTILLSGCSAAEKGKDRTVLRHVEQAAGLDLSGGQVIDSQDSHGGFHGDGNYLAVIQFSNHQAEQQMEDKGWNSLPPDETVKILLYGQETKERKDGPYFTDEEGNPLIPEVENGYYWLKDRQAKEGIAAGADILHRSSLNFSIAVYDADAMVLYYGEMDT